MAHPLSGVVPTKALQALAAKRAAARAAIVTPAAPPIAPTTRLSDREAERRRNRQLAEILANMPRQVGELQPQAGRHLSFPVQDGQCGGWPHTHCPGH